MKRIGLLLLVIAGIVTQIFAETIQFDIQNRDLNLIHSDAQSIDFTYGFDEIKLTNLESDKGIFQQLIIPETIIDGKIGTPGLPVRKRLIEIPWSAKYTVSAVSYEMTEYDLSRYGTDDKLFPIQPSIAKNVDLADIPFEMDTQAYILDSFGNEDIVSLEDVGVMRGVRIARLVINPVSYNPAQNKIRVYNDIKIKIELNGSDMALTEYNKDKAYSPYYEVIYNRVNRTYPNHDYPSHPDMRRYPIKYLIVANRMFESTLAPFIAWKEKKGFDVIVGYTDVIGTTSSAIKSWIQGYYTSATPGNPAPSFALIVGDVAQVINYGTGSSSNKGTDLYYYCFDGGSDYIPDMYYGRWSVTSTTELTNIINKTLYYEQYQFADPGYLDNVTLIAGQDTSWNPKVGQPTVQYGAANYFNSTHGFANVYQYLTSYTNCYNTMNTGVGFINYTAHGSTTSWSGPSFSNTDISNMTNTDKYPFAIGNCCITGQYAEVGTCFAEQFIRVADKGAFAYIGSAPNTYWFEDFYWSVGAFPITGDNDGYVPTYSETTWGAYDGPFMTDYVTTDATKFLGNLSVTEVHAQNFPSHSSDIYYWQAYMLFGDPSVIPYWTQGTTNTYSSAAFIPIGATTFTVNAEAGSYVGISQNGVLKGAALVGSTGTVDVPITAFTAVGTADLVITRPQRQPVITTVPVQPLSGPYVSVDNVVVNADGDNVITNGELVYLTITLENAGTSSANSVMMTLSESDEYITIANASHAFGTINPGETSTVTNGFSFNVSDSCPNNHPISLTATIISGANTWNSVINLTAYAPDLNLGAIVVNDGSNGNLDPSENATLQLTVSNDGGAAVTNLNLMLSTTYTNISITDNIETRTIEAGGSTVLYYPIVVSSSALIGDNVSFNLATTGMGYTYNESFGLTIGRIEEDFESGDFSGMSWYFDGNTDWFVTDSAAYDGTYSASNGDIVDSQTSDMLLDIDVSTNGNISFYRRVSSESGYDYLSFYIDDTLQERWSGEVAWSQVSYPVTAGTHILTWRYSKDSSLSNGSDCAWLDEIIFPPCTIVVPEADIALNPTSLDFGNVAIGTNSELLFTITNNGTAGMSGTIVTPVGYTVQAVTARTKEYTLQRTQRNTLSYTLAASSSKEFRAIFTPTALACYNFDIVISSNDPDTPVYNLPVSGCGSTVEASVDPSSITGNLNIGQSTDRTLTLTNSGDLEMTYSVSLTDINRGTGGPDTFGYTWIDSYEPDGPAFNWITPNTTNEISGLADDAAGTASPIGFSFPFYGNEYSSLYINANGMITFGAGSGSLSNSALPSTSVPNNMIAWFWDDMNPESASFIGHIYYQNAMVEGVNALVITFLDYLEYDGTATPADCVQAQVILFENGNIRIQYDYVGSTLDLTSETIGIENADGTDGLQIAYNTAGVNITDNYVADFIIAETTPSWISVSPTSGTVGANTDTYLSLNLDATDLVAGTYSKNIQITTNDPDNPVITIPVSITVGLSGDPVISVSTNTLSFGEVSVGSQSVLPITITNTGGAILSGNITTPYCYSVTTSSRETQFTSKKESSDKPIRSIVNNTRNTLAYTVNPGQSNTYNIAFSPLTTITYNGNISITSNDPVHPGSYVTVSGAGIMVDIDVTPSSVTVESSIDSSTDRIVQIANTGNASLSYSLNFVDTSRGSGGPDTFGYSWIDSNEPDGPTYSWIDIAASGTALTLTDDSSEEVTLPFTFNFYGNDYTTVFVNSNGFLSFGAGSSTYTDTTIPSTAVPNNMICPLWDDLKPIGTTWGNVYTQTVNGNFVVQFDAVSHYNSSTPTDPVTFEVILYPDGNIRFQYETIGIETDHHIGIENIDGTVGLQIADSGYVVNGLAVDILIVNTTEWISCNTAGGTLNGGASEDVTLTFNTSGLSYGTYQKNLVITSNDPDESTVIVPCTLIYSATQIPSISISANALDFGSIEVGSSAMETLTITNLGGGTLSGSLSTPSGYTASLVTKQVLRNTLSFNLPAGSSAMYDITFAPAEASTYNGNITITSNDADNPSETVQTIGSGFIPADIAINPTSLCFSLGTNATSSQNFSISNNGGQTLAYTITLEAEAGILLNEDFNSGLPGDWQIIDAGTSTDTWMNVADYNGTNTIDGSSFMFVNSDAAGSGTTLDEQLVTPGINCASAQSLYLDFDHFFQFYSSGGAEKAEVDIWDGIAWQNVLSMTSANVGSWTSPDHQNIDITTYANSNLKVRFHYYDADYDWFWAIDNVLVTATGSSNGWLSVNDTDSISGSISAGGNNNLSISVDTSDITEGVYTRNIILNSNDLDENHLIIPVSLTVTGAANQPAWEDEVVIYPNNTATIYCEVNLDGIPASTGDLLGAFVNGECRGFGSIILITRNTAYATLVLQSAGNLETVYFQLYDASDDALYDVETTCEITPGAVIGGAGVPQIINATSSLPTPQNLQISISGNTVTLNWTAVASATGYKVYTSSQANDWNGVTPNVVLTNSWSGNISENKQFYKVTSLKETTAK